MIIEGITNIDGIFFNNIEIVKGLVDGVIVYEKTQPTPTINAVKFTSTGNSRIGLAKKSTKHTLSYTRDGETWYVLDTSTYIDLGNRESVYVVGLLTDNNTSTDYTQFSITGNVAVSGNINYIWGYDNPDIELKEYCGNCLFQSCYGLTDASQLLLPATVLATGCYINMFSYCDNLVGVPQELPAQTMANQCYFAMFNTCRQITESPILKIQTTANQCCYHMFYDCSSLSKVTCELKDLLRHSSNKYNNEFNGWLDRVSSTGVFYKSAFNESWNRNANGIPSGWSIVNDVTALLFEGRATTNSSYLTLTLEKLSSNQYLEWTADGETWYNTDNDTFQLNLKWQYDTSGAARKYLVRGILSGSNSINDYTQFKAAYSLPSAIYFSIFGNINCLWNYQNLNTPVRPYCGYGLFANCKWYASTTYGIRLGDLIIPDATAESCYRYTFANSAVTVAPKLTGTTLGDSCYEYMFYGSTNLNKAPDLIAPTLSTNCYHNMFYNCSALNSIKCLATDISATNCTKDWTSGVASTGTFTKDANMSSWSTGVDGIPTDWTVEDA